MKALDEAFFWFIWSNNGGTISYALQKLTSVFIPSTKEATAATINMIKVRSCQASQRNIYRKHHTKFNQGCTVLHFFFFGQRSRERRGKKEGKVSNDTKYKSAKEVTQKLLPFFWGYVFDPNAFFRFNKSASSSWIPFSISVFNASATPFTWCRYKIRKWI